MGRGGPHDIQGVVIFDGVILGINIVVIQHQIGCRRAGFDGWCVGVIAGLFLAVVTLVAALGVPEGAIKEYLLQVDVVAVVTADAVIGGRSSPAVMIDFSVPNILHGLRNLLDEGCRCHSIAP